MYNAAAVGSGRSHVSPTEAVGTSIGYEWIFAAARHTCRGVPRISRILSDRFFGRVLYRDKDTFKEKFGHL